MSGVYQHKGAQQDPDATDILGRQPELAVWTPSNPFRWYGSIVEGERFTKQQVATLISRGADPVTVPSMAVRRQAKRTEWWFPKSVLPPRFEMQCPIVGKARDGRIRVVAPNGTLTLVQADGWGHRPFRIPDKDRAASLLRDGW